MNVRFLERVLRDRRNGRVGKCAVHSLNIGEGQLLARLAGKHKLIKANVLGARPKKGCQTTGVDSNVYIPHLMELPAIGCILIDCVAELLGDSIGALIAFYASYERNYFILVLCHLYSFKACSRIYLPWLFDLLGGDSWTVYRFLNENHRYSRRQPRRRANRNTSRALALPGSKP